MEPTDNITAPINNENNLFAKIISYIFHPMFLPLYCLLLLFNLNSYFSFELILKAKLLLIAFVGITTIIFPLIIIFLMKKQGLINSYFMKTKHERIYPYFIITIFYFFTFNLFRQIQLPAMYTLFMMGATILLLVISILNFWWKISIHLVGIGGLFGVITGLALSLSINLIFQIIIIIFIAGVVGYSRLKLNSHKPYEIYSGFLIGAIIMLSIFLFN